MLPFVSLFLSKIAHSEYEHVSSSSEDHPFNAQGYDIPKPEITLLYGFPNHIPSLSSPNLPEPSPTEINLIDSATETNPINSPTDSNLIDTPSTDAAIVENDSTTILTGDSLNSRKKRSLFHSQPKTIEIPTTTARPRTRYDDEGKWRIIRQEENKQPKKYDYL